MIGPRYLLWKPTPWYADLSKLWLSAPGAGQHSNTWLQTGSCLRSGSDVWLLLLLFFLTEMPMGTKPTGGEWAGAELNDFKQVWQPPPPRILAGAKWVFRSWVSLWSYPIVSDRNTRNQVSWEPGYLSPENATLTWKDECGPETGREREMEPLLAPGRDGQIAYWWWEDLVGTQSPAFTQATLSIVSQRKNIFLIA